MDNYLIDRQNLAELVDQLMEKKSLPDKTPEELDALREETIKALDDYITTSIFNSLSNEQLAELEQIFDRNEESPEVFTNFFTNAGVDLKQVISEAAQNFSAEFLGGENA